MKRIRAALYVSGNEVGRIALLSSVFALSLALRRVVFSDYYAETDFIQAVPDYPSFFRAMRSIPWGILYALIGSAQGLLGVSIIPLVLLSLTPARSVFSGRTSIWMVLSSLGGTVLFFLHPFAAEHPLPLGENLWFVAIVGLLSFVPMVFFNALLLAFALQGVSASLLYRRLYADARGYIFAIIFVVFAQGKLRGLLIRIEDSGGVPPLWMEPLILSANFAMGLALLVGAAYFLKWLFQSVAFEGLLMTTILALAAFVLMQTCRAFITALLPQQSVLEMAIAAFIGYFLLYSGSLYGLFIVRNGLRGSFSAPPP